MTPIAWKAPKDDWHYVYYPLRFRDRSEVVLHRAEKCFSEHEHMIFLHSLGFTRAVVIGSRNPRPQLILLQYHNNEPALDAPRHKHKLPTAWPKPQTVKKNQKFFQLPSEFSTESSHSLTWDLSPEDLQQFFNSGERTLCTWHSHLQVPDFVRDALTNAACIEGMQHSVQDFDRLIIYTDGSSKPSNRRKAPLWVQEQDTPDAWAFIVLGETYGSEAGPSKITFLGWHSQPVLYESTLPHFLGTDAIGSEFVEREGLFWAGLWRLSQNSTVPTVFRTDSSTTASQASGSTSCHDNHPTFVQLRSIFQALAAGLAEEDLVIEHVAGHAGDVWNELADFLAKTEAAHGHKLQRQQVDLRKWGHFLPFIWMMFDKKAGLPPLTKSGFDISPPKLPFSKLENASESSKCASKPAQISVSFATANIGSLFVGPEGYAGKVQYLREQMRTFRLNIMGLQETRSPPGMSTADNILRLAGGAHRGFGIEIWINLTQPIGVAGNKTMFLQKSHVQIIHADPRRLLARIDSPALQCHVFSAHAPQSGRSREERKCWWQETQDILQTHCKDNQLVVLIDANAKSGPKLAPIVFDRDDASSANTEFFRALLQAQNLCLPCTSQIHCGPISTWTSPDGTSSHRIDFVAVPQLWIPCCKHSSVISDFDLGNAHDDHQVVGLQIAWNDNIKTSTGGKNKKAFQREAIGTNRHLIACRELQATPCPLMWKPRCKVSILNCCSKLAWRAQCRQQHPKRAVCRVKCGRFALKRWPFKSAFAMQHPTICTQG